MLGTDGIGLAAANEKQYVNEGFSLSLPEDWEEISYDDLKEYEDILNKTIAKGIEQSYAHAFQLKSAKEPLEYPYITIQINRDGKISLNKLEKLKTYNFDQVNKEVKSRTQDLISQISINEHVFDPQSRIIWLKGAAVIQGENMTMISAIIKTFFNS